MTGTKVASEQLQFNSSQTGTHDLDTYLEAAERGGRPLADLITDIFDSNGNFIISGLTNWAGNWATSTSYVKGDTFLNAATNSVYVAIANHTSTSIASDLAANKIAFVIDLATPLASISTSVATAAAQATIATTQASNAATSAATATTQANNSATSASAALTAQTAAEAARDATLAAYDSFDDRYLGAKASDPALDNDGNALMAGSLYYNTSVPEMRLYTGSSWVAAYVTGGGFLASANNLSDLASASTARTNLGLGTAATTNATAYATASQGAKADTALQPAAIGVTVQGYDATTLKSSAIGVTVQGYDANTLKSSAIGVTVQGYDATTLKSAAIGSTVQGYDANTAKTNVAQAFTKTQTATSAALTSGNAADFSTYQVWTAAPNGGTFTITNPTSPVTGALYQIVVSYTTSHSIAWGTYFKGVSAVTPTATAGAVDIFTFRYQGSNVYALVGYSLNAGA